VLIAMEWSRGHGSRGLVRIMAAIRRAVRPVSVDLAILGFSALTGPDFAVWGWRIPFVLSIVLVGIGLWIRLGILETPVFQALLDDKRSRRLRSSSDQAATVGDPAVGARAHGRAGAILRVHRLRVRVRHHDVAFVARSDPDRGAGGVLYFRLLPFRYPVTSPTGSAGGRCT